MEDHFNQDIVTSSHDMHTCTTHDDLHSLSLFAFFTPLLVKQDMTSSFENPMTRKWEVEKPTEQP